MAVCPTGNKRYPMSRGPCTFKQRDVAAAAKAMRKAGFEVARVEIDATGKIVVVTGRPPEPADEKPNREKVTWKPKRP